MMVNRLRNTLEAAIVGDLDVETAERPGSMLLSFAEAREFGARSVDHVHGSAAR